MDVIVWNSVQNGMVKECQAGTNMAEGACVYGSRQLLGGSSLATWCHDDSQSTHKLSNIANSLMCVLIPECYVMLYHTPHCSNTAYGVDTQSSQAISLSSSPPPSPPPLLPSSLSSLLLSPPLLLSLSSQLSQQSLQLHLHRL